MAISYNEIARDPAHASALLAALDATSANDRHDVLSALRALAERLIVPAAPLMSHSDDGGPHSYFDLQEVAGSDFSGLLLGSLAARFPALQEAAPDDRALAAILDELGFEIDEPARRAAFFRAWMGLRATHVMRELLKVLEAGKLSAAEREELERIAQLPLPGFERQLIQMLLE
jgi:hypothetical protein